MRCFTTETEAPEEGEHDLVWEGTGSAVRDSSSLYERDHLAGCTPSRQALGHFAAALVVRSDWGDWSGDRSFSPLRGPTCSSCSDHVDYFVVCLDHFDRLWIISSLLLGVLL